MSTLTTAPTDRSTVEHHRLMHGARSSSGPIWTLNVLHDNELVRRIVVLAPSSGAALLKGREQLDDGEILSFCFAGSVQR